MRITFFLGRIHHAHKLLGVAAELQQAGAEIDILIADNSINIDPTTEYLERFGIYVFYHAKDYIGSGLCLVCGGDKNFDVEQDELEVDSSPCTCETGNAENESAILQIDKEIFKYFPPFWVVSSYKEAVHCIEGFSGYLIDRKPDAVFALHENNFWVRTLFYLAQEKNITTYSLQEGIILKREEDALKKYSTGTQYTDVLFSWSKHDKEFYSDTAKIVPVGPSHMDAWITGVESQKSRGELKKTLREQVGMAHKGKVIVFAPPRLDLYAGNFFNAAHALSKWTMNRNIGLIIKLHPFQGGVEQIKKELSRYSHVMINADADSLQYVALADALVTQTSTIAIEAALLGTPVIELDMDYHGLEQTIHQHGGALLIEGNNLDKIPEYIHDNHRGRTLNELSREMFVKEYFSFADGKSTKRIVDYVMAGLWVK